MKKKRFFGTDGIRGIVNKDLNVELCFKVGRALSEYFKNSGPILIGKDTRVSCDMIVSAVSSGICSGGVDVKIIGVCPTPAVANIVKNGNFSSGVMISASHNPYNYNGIKVFDENGFKLNDEDESKIESLIEKSNLNISENIGKISYEENLIVSYIDSVISIATTSFKNLKIAIDSANGSNYKIAKKIFEFLGAFVYQTAANPNGVNINQKCGSTYTDEFINFCKAKKTDIGISFDGDGDRVIFIDDHFELIDGDQTLAILAFDMHKNNKLNKNTVVTTVMSNIGLFNMAKKNEIKIIETHVGDKYVLDKMREIKANLGGEQSGHIINLEHSTTGDGLVTAINLLNIIIKSGKKLSELKTIIKTLPQITVSANVKNENKEKYLNDNEIKKKIEDIKRKFDGRGRILIRPSGTESLVRIMIEGPKNEANYSAKELAKLITSKFGN